MKTFRKLALTGVPLLVIGLGFALNANKKMIAGHAAAMPADSYSFLNSAVCETSWGIYSNGTVIYNFTSGNTAEASDGWPPHSQRYGSGVPYDNGIQKRQGRQGSGEMVHIHLRQRSPRDLRGIPGDPIRDRRARKGTVEAEETGDQDEGPRPQRIGPHPCDLQVRMTLTLFLRGKIRKNSLQNREEEKC